MTSNAELLCTNEHGQLAITLNRPEVGNALSQSLVENLIGVFTSSQNVRSCVIRAEGPNFCTGFDLSSLDVLSDGDLVLRFVRTELMLQAVQHAPFPVLALAQGHAIGAGADLFAACTSRIVAPDCQFRMPGWNFELALGTRRLAAIVGADAARAMLLADESLNSAKAAALGLATRVAPTSEWEEVESQFRKSSARLTEAAVSMMLPLVIRDTRDTDLAWVARSAGRPGLKQRIQEHRLRAQQRGKRSRS